MTKQIKSKHFFSYNSSLGLHKKRLTEIFLNYHLNTPFLGIQIVMHNLISMYSGKWLRVSQTTM
jgi:hypothetical protein